MTTSLEKQVLEFVDRRLEKELWETGEDETKYNKDADKIIGLARKRYGKDSLECRMIEKLSDLYCMQVYEMQGKAYKLGFKDGLKIQKLF